MALYEVKFTIQNNTDQTMAFDSQGSQGTHGWPTEIPAGQSGTVTQSGNLSINLTAVYSMGSSSVNAYLHFYLTGLDPLVHTNMSLSYSDNDTFTNNEIYETTSHSPETETGKAPLSISKTNNGSSGGNATFTLG